MVALGIAFWMWSKRKRTPGMDPRAAWDAVKGGAPITNELAGAVGRYVAMNSRPAQGVVDEVLNPDRYGVLLPDGSRVQGVRGHKLWRRRIVLAPGVRVALSMVPGDDHASIVGRL